MEIEKRNYPLSAFDNLYPQRQNGGQPKWPFDKHLIIQLLVFFGLFLIMIIQEKDFWKMPLVRPAKTMWWSTLNLIIQHRHTADARLRRQKKPLCLKASTGTVFAALCGLIFKSD